MINQFATAGLLGFLYITPAFAAPFSVSGSNVTAADGFLSFTLSGDTASRTGQMIYNESEPAPNGIDLTMTSFTDPAARFSVIGSQFVNSLDFPERSLSFTVSDKDFRYTVDNGSDLTAVKGYTFTFDIAALFAPDGSIIEYDAPSAVPILLPTTFFEAYGIDVTGSPLSLVPLPTSAPLFGLALGVLGVVGFHSRWRAKAAA